MEKIANKKPCVVETPQGFSVSYNNRFLYSKYNPSKLIIAKIQELSVLPGTIFICNSPCLCYGLKELINKLKENSIIILCEFNKDLEKLGRECEIFNSLKNDSRLIFPLSDTLYDFPVEIYNLCKSGKYKRVISLDFSSGVQFSPKLYANFTEACVNSVKTFWTNRLTLTKFGRKYSYNFFTNLKQLPGTVPIENYFGSVDRPIIVAGAGQSVDEIYEHIKNYKDNFYIICVDTILSSFIKKDIIPQCVFVEEAQTIISKAFLCKKFNIHLFQGLSSLPLLHNYFKNENISYFTTEFTQSNFIKKLDKKNLLPPINPPFGSVGITAVYYSLKFRKNDSVPIYITGLDFSYSPGITHGKGTLAHKEKIISGSRINSLENLNAAYSPSSIPFKDKNGNLFITTPSLLSYGNLFNNIFQNEKNIFDIGNSGLPLSIPRKSLNSLIKDNKSINLNNKNLIKDSIFYDESFKNSLKKYFATEKEELLELKSLLTENKNISENQLEKNIRKIVYDKEYLFLHFPDGYGFKYDQSFLNRLRTELDFFLNFFY